jgi:3'(2'), 5'-bisphosphate nucleotidase
VLSEEGTDMPWDDRKHSHRLWLIDSIGGTKDFTQRTDEFTANIALIEDGVPVLSVVTAPALNDAYRGAQGEDAFKRDRTGAVPRISVAIARQLTWPNHQTRCASWRAKKTSERRNEGAHLEF